MSYRPLALIVIATVIGFPAHRQQSNEGGTFIVTSGRDTVAIERYTRTRRHIVGDLFLAAPYALFHYEATLGPTGEITRLRSVTKAPHPDPSDPPTIDKVTSIRGDSATIVVAFGGMRDSLGSGTRANSRGAVPMLPYGQQSYGLLERELAAALKPGSDSGTLSLLVALRRPLATARLVRRPDGVVSVQSPLSPQSSMLVRLDARGQISSVDASATQDSAIVERVARLDFDGFVRRWAPPKVPVAERGPRLLSKAPELSARDQFGRVQDLQSLNGPNGLVMLFFRSADW